jgi:hypothetical protein
MVSWNLVLRLAVLRQKHRRALDVLLENEALLDGVAGFHLIRGALLGPFELRDNRVLGRRGRDEHAKDLLLRSARQLFAREGTILARHEVDLPRAAHVDDVEHGAPAEGIARRVRIQVERVHVEVREKVVERGRQWIDDDIEVLSRPRLAVDRARKRANDHVRDLGGFEELLDLAKRGSEAIVHGARSGA